MASGMERTSPPFWKMGCSPPMPLSCSTILSTATPDRSARDTSRPMASVLAVVERPGLADGGKHLEGPSLKFGHGDIEVTVSGLHLGGEAFQGLGPVLNGAPWPRPPLLSLAEGEDLVFLAAVAVDGDALAPQLVGQVVDLPHVFHRGIPGQVHGLGYRIVRVLLKGRLHAHVPLGGDVVGRHEDPPHVFGDLLHLLDAAFAGDWSMSSGRVKPLSLATFSKIGLTSRSSSLSMTVRTKLRANRGSMPLEQPAMMLRVPVGAMVVVVALLQRQTPCP